jgi:hypothetical protein
LVCCWFGYILHEDLAGVLGFEPRDAGIKTRCLTAWLHPTVLGSAILLKRVGAVNGILRKNLSYLSGLTGLNLVDFDTWQNINEVYATFLGDLFAATRYKYVPVGSLSPSMATEVAYKKSPRNAATSFANILSLAAPVKIKINKYPTDSLF